MPLFNPETLTIIESITDPFVFLDREMRYVVANQAARQLLNKTSDELLGKFVWDVFPQPPGSLFRGPIDLAARTGEVTHVTGLNPVRGIWFECDNFPSDHGLAILFRDVTEQRRMAEANENAERQLAFLAEASRMLGSSIDFEETLSHVAELMVPRLADWCAVDLLDPDGSLRRVAVAHLDKMIRLGIEPDLPISLARIADLGEPVVLPVISDDVLRQNAISDDHFQHFRNAGLSSLMAVPLKRRDSILGILMMAWAEPGKSYTDTDLRFAEDVAARAAVAIENARLYRDAKAAADRLKAFNSTLERNVEDRTQKLGRAVKLLEARNRELQDFAYVASHDLQEPLRKISTFAELVVEEFGEVVGEDGRYYLSRMQDASRRMARLITDLLSYSRISSRAEPFQSIDLNEILDLVRMDVEMAVKDAKGTIDVGMLPTIEADPTQMRQLFQNLIVNALKFRKPDVLPVVKVQSANGTSSNGKGSYDSCVIEVADNGIGFDERHVGRIFLPFKRLNSRDHYPGTGVGLAICKRIVDRHGGAIAARSAPGEGSTFRVTLPLRQRGE